jgi:hypothetical protein
VNDRIVRAGALTIVGRLALIATAIATVGLFAFSISAQTLTDPNPRPGWSPPRTSAKAKPTARLKACPSYGPGFVQLPGTDTCVKIGGWVTVEGSTSH